MFKRFIAAREDEPGEAWRARFAAGRDDAVRWYVGDGLADPPTALQCRDALRQHMPELVPHYDRVCALVGDDDLAHRILSHYRPPPVIHGCSQAVWLGDGGPALVRNYDFPLDMVSDRFEMTRVVRAPSDRQGAATLGRHSRRAGFTTVYTAVRRPAEGRVDYLWPGKGWSQSFDNFTEVEYTHDYGELL
jgi:predicted choloylglycine hydrolase